MKRIIILVCVFIFGVVAGLSLGHNRNDSQASTSEPSTQAQQADVVAEPPRARSTIGAIGSLGFIVQDFLVGSPAERAGLQKNDIIVRVGGKQFQSMKEFSNFGQQEPGSLFQFMVVRHENGHKNSYTMEVATVPAPQSLEQ